jgi:hypothetical protein
MRLDTAEIHHRVQRLLATFRTDVPSAAAS